MPLFAALTQGGDVFTIDDKLKIYAGAATASLDLAMKHARRPENKKPKPRFSALRAAAILGRDKSEISRAIPSVSTITKADPTRYSLSIEDIDGLRTLLGMEIAPAPGIVVSISNQKGGVGKTTTAAHLSTLAAIRGYRCLVVDLDPQASMTSFMGCAGDIEVALEDTAYAVLVGDEESLVPKIRRCDHIDRMDYVPACMELSAASEEGFKRGSEGAAPDWHLHLSRALAPLLDTYDLIFLDCPPSFSIQNFNALFASHLLIIPTGANMLDLASTGRFLRWIHEGAAGIAGKRLQEIRLLMTNYDGSVSSGEAYELAMGVYGSILCKNVAEHSSEVQRASLEFKTVFELERPLRSRSAWGRAQASMDDVNQELLAVIESIRYQAK